MPLFFSETGLKIQKRVIEKFQGSKDTSYSCLSQGSRVKASSQGHAGQRETGCSPSLFPWVWLAPQLFVNVFSRIVWGKWRDSNWGLTMNSVWSHFLKSKVPKSGVPDQLWNSSCYSKKKSQHCPRLYHRSICITKIGMSHERGFIKGFAYCEYHKDTANLRLEEGLALLFIPVSNMKWPGDFHDQYQENILKG